VTQKAKAIKAQSESLASAKLGLCNAGGVCFKGSSEGPGPGRPQGVVARSVCAEGTRPHSRLALWAARPVREPFNIVNRPGCKWLTRLAMVARQNLRRGFTLIELMVVLVIIGVLAALIVPNVLDRADDARATAARTDINNLVQALKLFKLDNQRYPTAEQGLAALVGKPTAGPIPQNWKAYLDKLPNDPWNNPYQYLNPGLKGEVDVLSFGADGQPGGEGKNADVGSWQ